MCEGYQPSGEFSKDERKSMEARFFIKKVKSGSGRGGYQIRLEFL